MHIHFEPFMLRNITTFSLGISVFPFPAEKNCSPDLQASCGLMGGGLARHSLVVSIYQLHVSFENRGNPDRIPPVKDV